MKAEKLQTGFIYFTFENLAETPGHSVCGALNMDLTELNKFQLYDHLCNINDAYIRAIERNNGTPMDEESLLCVRDQFREVILELRRRQKNVPETSHADR